MFIILLNLISVYSREAVYQNYNSGGDVVNSSKLDASALKDTSLNAWASMMFGEAPMGNLANPLIDNKNELAPKSNLVKTNKSAEQRTRGGNDSSESSTNENKSSKGMTRLNTTEEDD
jgi:hypothetical protein